MIGEPVVIDLHPKGTPSVRLSRNALSELGAKLAAEVEPAEVIAVELAFQNESFMLAAVISESGPRTVAEDFESYLGKFKAGDVVLDVRKLEPVSLGSAHYIYRSDLPHLC